MHDVATVHAGCHLAKRLLDVSLRRRYHNISLGVPNDFRRNASSAPCRDVTVLTKLVLEAPCQEIGEDF